MNRSGDNPTAEGSVLPRHDPRQTPAMRQYFAFKKQHPDCVLFFRMGDFYEMFDDDAILAHKVLGVTLTQRTAGVPMAGVPFHAVEGYLRRMILAGYRVAVCDQTEDPAKATGPIVQRAVTRVVTPGTLTDAALLDEARENPLVAVMFIHKESGKLTASPVAEGAWISPSAADDPATGMQVAVAWAEASTGTFCTAVFSEHAWVDELARLAPGELLYVETAHRQPPPLLQKGLTLLGCPATARPAWPWRAREARDILCKQFGVSTLAGFGLHEEDPTLGPAGAIVHYLIETQLTQSQSSPPAGATGATPVFPRLLHLQPPKRHQPTAYLVIDQSSLRSLEIERTMRSGQVAGSLLGTLGDCCTAMGKRLLRQWLCYPLRDRPQIQARQRIVGSLVNDPLFLDPLRRTLEPVQDVQRMVTRLSLGRGQPRDLVALGRSCAAAEKLADLLDQRESVRSYHRLLQTCVGELKTLATTIAQACVESPPGHLREGGVFRDGFDAVLDACRALQRDGSTWLAQYQKRLTEETGIPTLKVGFNKVFGFYIELSAGQRDKAPASWTRKQTLKHAERFITAELKQYEDQALSAEQRGIAREQELFTQLCLQAQQALPRLRTYAQIVAELDVLACFAQRAVRRRYVCPELVDEPVLLIKGGRHPVLEEMLGDQFVPNDVELGGQGTASSLALITGPNMAGKSTYIRQAALLTLLAHTGSWVPADRAVVGLTDRIFTRIGASDELHAGQSTFMVEMTETANLCHHATPASLVILDEIGRGTSTLDGLSLAWAIAEYLAQRGCRTLFATHYHEITALAEATSAVCNRHVSVREWGDQIVFLHRVEPGATDRSYGIHVAKIAGLPQPIIQRAHQLLGRLEVNHEGSKTGAGRGRGAEYPEQGSVASDPTHLSACSRSGGNAGLNQRPQHSTHARDWPLFTQYLEHPVLEVLRQKDLNHLSPLEAFDFLRQLQRELSHDHPEK